jgi:hypothetical protein
VYCPGVGESHFLPPFWAGSRGEGEKRKCRDEKLEKVLELMVFSGVQFERGYEGGFLM